MPPRPSRPPPESFTTEKERGYWHAAQDIAYRAGKLLLLRDGATWLVDEAGAKLICRPAREDKVWFETWKILHADLPLLSRMWVGGRAITKPGEMEHRRPSPGPTPTPALESPPPPENHPPG